MILGSGSGSIFYIFYVIIHISYLQLTLYRVIIIFIVIAPNIMSCHVFCVYSASEIPEYRLPWRAVRWEIEQMVEHGRGGVRIEYGRRLFSSSAGNSRPGDITLKVRTLICRTSL